MSENKEHDAREVHPDAEEPRPRTTPTAAGDYVEGDYGDAGTPNTGTTPTGTGDYVEGDYGDAGTPNTGTTATGTGDYVEGDYGDAGTTDGSGTQEARPLQRPADRGANPKPI